MKKLLLPGAAAALLLVAAFADHLPEVHSSFAAEEEDVPVFNYSEEPAEKAAETYSSLEDKLVGTEEKDGYVIEKYEEYEIYSDEKGNVTKSVPTSHFSYLRYKKAQ
ncbi:hypothetical protein LRR81_00440 [Metabacillus sp. GX 13764]|uniref:hypothetical protein n=1 Tax=Metabacillus kandeliae TaxID=2900151 RepID=UPI001E4FC223|nr:hypothetical protein [Metabacillus kandeliae]MCD7032676.1 hypothetical protein [Metabacillus kandeliae]